MADPRTLPIYDPARIAYSAGILGQYPDQLNALGMATLRPADTVRGVLEWLTPAGDVTDLVSNSGETARGILAGDLPRAGMGLAGMGLALAGTVAPGRPAAAMDPLRLATGQAVEAKAFKGGPAYDWQTDQPIAEWKAKLPEGGDAPWAGFFSDSPEVASKFAAPYSEKSAVFPVSVAFKNPLVIDAEGRKAREFQFSKEHRWYTPEFMRLFEGDHDGVIITNTADEGTIYIPKASAQARSIFDPPALDPVAENAARMQRAASMGYTRPMYHATRGEVLDFPYFEPEPTLRGTADNPHFQGQKGDFGIHVTPNPETARGALDPLYRMKEAQLARTDLDPAQRESYQRDLDYYLRNAVTFPLLTQEPIAPRLPDLGRWDKMDNFKHKLLERSWNRETVIGEKWDDYYKRMVPDKVEGYEPKPGFENLTDDRGLILNLRDRIEAIDLARRQHDLKRAEAFKAAGEPQRRDFATPGQWSDAYRAWQDDPANDDKIAAILADKFDENLHWRKAFREELENRGYNAVRYSNSIEGTGEDSFMFLNPQDVRSRHAQFDPARRNDADMMASIAAVLGGGGILGLSYLGQDDRAGPGA